MFKKTIPFLFITAVLLTGCKKGTMIEEMKVLTIENITIHEQFQAAIDSSKSGKDVAAAIDKFTDATVSLRKRSMALGKKYPSIIENSDFPELKEVNTKLASVSQEISKKMTAVMEKYKNNKDIIKALNNLEIKLIIPIEPPANTK